MGAPIAERTYRPSNWTRWGTTLGLVVIGGLGLVFVAGALLPGTRPHGPERFAFGAGALAVLAAGAVVFAQARTLGSSAVTVRGDGIQPRGEGAGFVPWSSVTGARRGLFPAATQLTDAAGVVLLAIDDRLDGVEDCLAAVADAASIERPSLPARWSIRAASPAPIVAAIAIAGFGLLAATARTDALGWVFAVAFAGVIAWLAAREPIVLEIDEAGFSIRRIWTRETFRWDEVLGCGFRVMRSRNSRWVESSLQTARGACKLVPAGAPMLPIVALVRERIRGAAPGR